VVRITDDAFIALQTLVRGAQVLRLVRLCISLSVCLSLREDISGTTRAIFIKLLCMLLTVVARSFSGKGASLLSTIALF